MPQVRIEYRDVSKRFQRTGRGRREAVVTAVEKVSLSVSDKEVVSLIGPSGCGKSTLLNMGSGLYQPTEGSVYVDGDLVVGRRADETVAGAYSADPASVALEVREGATAAVEPGSANEHVTGRGIDIEN